MPLYLREWDVGGGGGEEGEGELKNLESAPNNHPKNQYHILDVKTDCSICLPTLVIGLLGQNVPIITIWASGQTGIIFSFCFEEKSALFFSLDASFVFVL